MIGIQHPWYEQRICFTCIKKSVAAYIKNIDPACLIGPHKTLKQTQSLFFLSSLFFFLLK